MTTLTTGVKAARRLQAAIILSSIGATKLPISGIGNPFVREDGTAIVIFNVAAFGNKADALAASKLYNEGLALEAKGDAQGAHDKFVAAYNIMLSFSVLAENAPQYSGCYEVTAKVDLVDSKKNVGTKVYTLNQVRPVAVATNGSSDATLFASPATAAPAASSATPAIKRPRAKAQS